MVCVVDPVLDNRFVVMVVIATNRQLANIFGESVVRWRDDEPMLLISWGWSHGSNGWCQHDVVLAC